MKRFRMFAGPNGSGKSTLIKEITQEYNMGFYINADDIEKKLNSNKFLDCNDYVPKLLIQTDWEKFIPVIKAEDKRVTPELLTTVKISDGILVVQSVVNSYLASVIAEFFRFILLECQATFSFETVMSHSSKISFLEKAKRKGFKIYLYFISTQDPSINVNRVKIRVSKGGHAVDKDKIEKRYYHSMELLSEAFLNADRAFIFDNSTDTREQRVLVEKNEDEVKIHTDEIPEWIQIYLVDKLNTE